MTPLDESVECVPGTLGNDLNPSVTQIAHPSGEPQTSRDLLGMCAEKHTLYNTADPDVHSIAGIHDGITARETCAVLSCPQAALIWSPFDLRKVTVWRESRRYSWNRMILASWGRRYG